jgi:hypothetical protein
VKGLSRIPFHVVLLAILTSVVVTLVPIHSAAATPVLVENFKNNQFDSTHWHTAQIGLGPTWDVANGRFEVTIPADSTIGPPSYTELGAALTSSCLIRGDFDMQVGFQLLTWPPANGVSTGLGMSFLVGGIGKYFSPTPLTVERDSFGPNANPSRQESYLTDFSDGVQGIVPTNSTTGIIRLTRSGGAATGYYLNSSGWVTIHDGPAAFQDFGFGFGAWSDNLAFSHESVKIAFNNFTLTSGLLICPQITAAPTSGIPGTHVIVQGIGFPGGIKDNFYGPDVELTFDNNFIGMTTMTSLGKFTLSFNVPVSQPGTHLIKAWDIPDGVNASTLFLVQPVIAQALSVKLNVGPIYFPGDNAIASIMVTLGGRPLATTVQVGLAKPDGSVVQLNPSIFATGAFEASYKIPINATLGGYSILATVHLQGIGEGAALGSFQVKLSWLASHGSTLVVEAASSATVVGAAVVARRRGFFKE